MKVILNNMTAEDKIGQMLMVGISGQSLNENDIELLSKYRVGGIILFDRNMHDCEQVAGMISEANKIRSSQLPLYVAIDEEGGRVARMKDRLQPSPSAEKLGRMNNPDLAEQYAINTAQKLRAMGININLAPVADVGLSMERSYSKDYKVVTEYVHSAIKGYMQTDMLCCLKHFPGIGKGIIDSHVAKSNIGLSLTDLQREDLFPFLSAIENFDNNNFWIMVSHFLYDQLDGEYPASISPKIITDLLREKLHFKGIVITDDLEMKALSQYYPPAEVGVRAVKAGADMLLLCHDFQYFVNVYEGIMEAYSCDETFRQRIETSAGLIIKNKLQHLIV